MCVCVSVCVCVCVYVYIYIYIYIYIFTWFTLFIKKALNISDRLYVDLGLIRIDAEL